MSTIQKTGSRIVSTVLLTLGGLLIILAVVSIVSALARGPFQQVLISLAEILAGALICWLGYRLAPGVKRDTQ